ncbi:glycosyl hydrolase family protein, partial [bacterium]
MIEFPKDFFWGAATSAYQVEGGNSNSDWWEWENKAGLRDKSGEACRHYQL